MHPGIYSFVRQLLILTFSLTPQNSTTTWRGGQRWRSKKKRKNNRKRGSAASRSEWLRKIILLLISFSDWGHAVLRSQFNPSPPFLNITFSICHLQKNTIMSYASWLKVLQKHNAENVRINGVLKWTFNFLYSCHTQAVIWKQLVFSI